MAKVLITDTHMTDIADAIREKLGVATTYTPDQMAAAIESIEDTLVAKTITENGTYDPADDNADGYSGVTVNVPTSTPNLQSKTVTQNGTVTADSGYDGLSSVTVNVSGGGGNVQGFELYAATFDGGTQRFPRGVFDNKYFVCCFHDNMSNRYTLNGVDGNYSATEPGKNGGYIRATTLAVTNQQTTQDEALIPIKGSVFISYHDDSGSYMSVVGGWVGYPTGGTIYESVATGTTNAITMNSAHPRLLIFFAASNTGLSSVSTVDVNGVTHSVVNMGVRYDGVYSLYTAIEINNNSDTTITVTMPASCYSYLSIIGI